MALRPVALLSLMTFALIAGCSDGPPAGDVVAIPGVIGVDGSTAENTYTAESGGIENPQGERVCNPLAPPEVVPPCVAASSTYVIHFMDLPEPSGEGYQVFQMGGSIGERNLAPLASEGGNMWGLTRTVDENQEGQFESFEVRMGDFVVATASAAAGSQAFVANPALSTVTVTASYKAKTFTAEVSGLPEEGEFVGRFYTRGLSGNLTVGETFPVVNGPNEFVSRERNIGAYEEFHIHVGSSKIYLYQGTI